MPRAMTKGEASVSPTRAKMESGSSSSQSVVSVAGPMIAMLSNVPSPIRTRIASTTTRMTSPVSTVAPPMDNGVCCERPSWKTVHAPWPFAPRTMKARPTPNSQSPTTIWIVVRGVGRR